MQGAAELAQLKQLIVLGRFQFGFHICFPFFGGFSLIQSGICFLFFSLALLHQRLGATNDSGSFFGLPFLLGLTTFLLVFRPLHHPPFLLPARAYPGSGGNFISSQNLPFAYGF
jgi:hypothetical protein